MGRVAMPDGVVSLSGENTDKLLKLGQGDAALLYLALLRAGGDLPQARRALGWSEGRLDGAYTALAGASLVGPAPAAEPEKPPAPAETAPEYVTRDVLAALEGDPAFARLQSQVEQQLGTILTPADLKTLYLIYDYLALPPEVIRMLTTWCIQEMERKYGPSRRPRLSQIKKTALRWRDNGIDTLEAAEEYLKREQALRDKVPELLPEVGIRDRAPLDNERAYLTTWIDWGFPPETVGLAYQKTIMKKQTMSWSYMNSILRNWHGKGLHTLQEVEEGDRLKAPAGQGGKEAPPAKNRRMAQDLADLKRMMNKKEG